MRLTSKGAPGAVSVLLVLAVSASTVRGELVWFYGGPFDQAIPADPEATRGWMEDAIIEVPDHLVITDLNVSVSLTHTNTFDLELRLISPSGTSVLLNAYDPFTEYFEGANYRQTVFDDEAAASITAAAPPFTGSWQPRSAAGLTAFDGEDAFGSWRLRIYDNSYLDTGQLDAFGLTITTPEPATLVLLVAGLGLLRPLRRRIH